MAVFYEWDVEQVATVDHTHSSGQEFAAGDVMEHYHQESYSDCLAFIASGPDEENSHHEICIVRDHQSERNGDETRSWAYIEDGVLDDGFYDANAVMLSKTPKRFFDEMERAHKANGAPKIIWNEKAARAEAP